MPAKDRIGPSPEESLGLVQAAYDAAGTVGGWSEFLDRYIRAFGAAGVWLGHQDFSSDVPLITCAAGWEPSGIRAFQDHFGHVNPYRGMSLLKPMGRVHHVHELVPKPVAMKTEFYSDFVRPMKRHLAGLQWRLLEHRGGAEASGMAVHYGLDRDEAVVEAAMPHHQRLVPHVQSAMRLHERLGALETQAAELTVALECTRAAIVTCDHQGRVLFLNAAAERILARRDGIYLSDGFLRAERCAGGRCLQRAVAETALLAERRSLVAHSALLVTRAAERPDYELLLFPLPERHDALRARGGRALVFIHDPGSSAPSMARVLADLYRLTPREAEIVTLLAQGLRPADIGERLELGAETIKSHLRAALAKTDTRSQSQLLAKVLSGVARFLHELPGTD